MSVYSEVEPLPPDVAIIQIGLRDWEMGKTYPADIAVRADVRETLRVLTPLIVELGGAAQRQRAADGLAALAGHNWTANRKVRAEAASAKAAAQPIDPEWLMLTITDLLPKDAIVVDEALTTATSLAAFLRVRDRYGYFGNISGGIGWGIAAAVGVQLAQPDRKVVALLGDGSAMYSIQALWTAAHQKLPITFRRVQQWRLPNHQAAAEAVPRHRALYRHGFCRSADRVRRAGTRAWRAGSSYRNPGRVRSRLCDAVAAREPVLIEVMVDGSV